jgi:hypothetical protein
MRFQCHIFNMKIHIYLLRKSPTRTVHADNFWINILFVIYCAITTYNWSCLTSKVILDIKSHLMSNVLIAGLNILSYSYHYECLIVCKLLKFCLNSIFPLSISISILTSLGTWTPNLYLIPEGLAETFCILTISATIFEFGLHYWVRWQRHHS